MTEFEKVLQECLHDLEEGASSLEECLSRHPKYAAELRPILLASTYFACVREVHVSDEFKTRVRGRVMKEIHAHPRPSWRKPVAARSGSMFLKLAISLAAVLVALLVTGTAYAQRALPGNAFYDWKLVSENAWRMFSSDPVGTDLKIAARRADELIAVSGNPALYPQSLKIYLETTDRLKSEANGENKVRILPMLDSQVRKLRQSGITLPLLDKDVSPSSAPIPIPTATPFPISPTLQPAPTELLQLTPTIPTPPEVAPTSRVPSGIVPKLHSPPAIAPTTRSQIP